MNDGLDAPGTELEHRFPLGQILVLLIFLAALLGLAFILQSIARKQFGPAFEVSKRGTHDWPEPLEFAAADPQYRHPFDNAVSRGFFTDTTRSSISTSPALKYLDKRGVTDVKLSEKYENLWRMLEHLQLRQDFRFERRALEAFRTASTKDVLEMLRPGVNASEAEDELTQYTFLADYHLAWYIDTYYLQPALALASSSEVDRARSLIREAADRLRFRGFPLRDHRRVRQVNQTFLLEALFSDPVALIGHDAVVNAFVRLILENFPGGEQFALEKWTVDGHLGNMKDYVNAVYAFRARKFSEAETSFNELAQRKGATIELRELSVLLAMRCKFWSVHTELVRNKRTLDDIAATALASEFNEAAGRVRNGTIRANLREYAQIVKTDFISAERLYPKPAQGEKSRGLAIRAPAPATPQGPSSDSPKSQSAPAAGGETQ